MGRTKKARPERFLKCEVCGDRYTQFFLFKKSLCGRCAGQIIENMVRVCHEL